MTDNTVSLISVIISAMTVLLAMGALLTERRQSRLALGATFLRELEKELLWSEKMQRRRLRIARFLKNRKDLEEVAPPEVSDLLDWMDHVGLYWRKRVFDLEMTWTTMFYWFGHYWVLLEHYAERYEKRAGNIAFYENARVLYNRLYRFGERRKGMPSQAQYYSQENLQTFIEFEIRTCSQALEELP